MRLPEQLRCTPHRQPMRTTGNASIENAASLECADGCRIPIIDGVPRFVGAKSYADAFGMQWKQFRQTQLDSHTGTTISKDRLTRCFGGSLEIVRDRTVLEVGCGAGRFTEILLNSGARVFACDLSAAVEANYLNFGRSKNYFACQADVRNLPAAENAFDFVMCLGVIQHTPSPEETIKSLAQYVRPGGVLVIDHYTHGYPANFVQRNIRRLLIRLPPRVAKPLALALARTLLPLHRVTWKNRRGIWRLRAPLLRYSPLIDYHEAYPELGDRLLSEWSILDTHDTLTDYYKHLRSAEEIENTLRSCGLVNIEVSYAGNGIEARARMPVAQKQNTMSA